MGASRMLIVRFPVTTEEATSCEKLPRLRYRGASGTRHFAPPHLGPTHYENTTSSPRDLLPQGAFHGEDPQEHVHAQTKLFRLETTSGGGSAAESSVGVKWPILKR